MLDSFGRKINYLRISLTDKCNLRCRYCMPASGIKLKKHEDILTLEEIFEIVKYATTLGIDKVRLTGGEPLVRRNIEFLVEKIGNLSSVKDFGMTTNGTLLAEKAAILKELGLHRVNISIDSLDREKFHYITRGGNLEDALRGFEAAIEADLTPVKINVVLIHGWNDSEKEDFLRFGEKNGAEIRFIHIMNLKCGTRYEIEGNTDVGKCVSCNRIRLTCDGYLKPCLFSNRKIDVRETGLAEAFRQVVNDKPLSGQVNSEELMYQIGG